MKRRNLILNPDFAIAKSVRRTATSQFSFKFLDEIGASGVNPAIGGQRQILQYHFFCKYFRRGWKCIAKFGLIFSLAIMFLGGGRAEAFFWINEILADPPSGLAGDSNQDGVGSASNDEFVELFNNGNSLVDISGWSLSDALNTRHIFPIQTVLSPYEFLVIFGGGSPNLSNIYWQKASSGGLSLNNTADTVTIFDSQSNVIDQAIYGSLANHDQSIVRFPEGEGDFVLHSSVAQGKKFSPGTTADGRTLTPAAVPELPMLMYGAMGGVFLRFLRKRL